MAICLNQSINEKRCEAMKRQISIGLVFLIVVLTAATTFNVTYLAIWNGLNKNTTTAANSQKLSEILGYISQYYITDYDETALSDGAAAGLVEALPDQWSYYMSAQEYAEYSDPTSDDYVGIGVTGMYDETYQAIRVTEVHAESPAANAGLRYFDLITAVDGTLVSELGFEESVDRIRGVEGSSVEITYIQAKDGVERTVAIVRENVTQTD